MMPFRFQFLRNVFCLTLLIRSISKIICDALRNLVSFVQFKKCEKQPWSSVTFSKVASFNCATHQTNLEHREKQQN